MVLLAGAVWLFASQVNRRAAGSVVELNALLKLPPSARQQVDIARMDLLCSQRLPGAESADLAASLAELDKMAGRVRSETERHLYRFQTNPAEFENSEGFFRMVMLAVVLAEDFGGRYLKSLTPPEELAVFLSIRGMCLREAGRLPAAAEAFAAAARLAPACRGYQVMLASLQGRHAPSLSAVSPQAAQTITKDNRPNL